MLKQDFGKIGDAIAFLDKHSHLCIDGQPCDTLGDIFWTADGRRYRERNFKEYRKFSPQFRKKLIVDFFRDNDMNVTECSCSCSKCGTIAADETYWI